MSLSNYDYKSKCYIALRQAQGDNSRLLQEPHTGISFLALSQNGRGNYPTVTSKSTPIYRSRKRSASGIFLQTKKDSGQAGMTDKKLKTKKRLLQQRVSFNNDMTVKLPTRNEKEPRKCFRIPAERLANFIKSCKMYTPFRIEG